MSATSETILIFEDVNFINNDYGNPTFQVTELLESGILWLVFQTLTIT